MTAWRRSVSTSTAWRRGSAARERGEGESG